MFRDDNAMLLELELFERTADPQPGDRADAPKALRPAPPVGVGNLEDLSLLSTGRAGDDLAKLGLLPVSGRRDGLATFGLVRSSRRSPRPWA